MNVAAVNYDFGYKENLYAQVLGVEDMCAIVKHPLGLGVAPDAPPAERLHAFVKSMLHRLMDEGRPAWQGKLMSREMVEPTAALLSYWNEGLLLADMTVAMTPWQTATPEARTLPARLCSRPPRRSAGR